MGERFSRLEGKHRAFIDRQHIFFTSSAAEGTRINLSPRSTTALRVIDDQTVVYLDRTGSGNETAAHLLADGRLTIMMCAFEGPPMILRLYGHGKTLHRESVSFVEIIKEHFAGEMPPGARQIIQLHIELVQKSCGFGVPRFEYQSERDSLDRWTEKQGPDGIRDYWRDENQQSMDGLPTGIFDGQLAD